MLISFILVAMLAGCAVQPSQARPDSALPSPAESAAHHAVEPSNATDAQRLQLLTKDPLFSGATAHPSTPEADESANYNLNRGYAVSAVFGGDPNGAVSVAAAHAQLERIQADGWNVVAVECLVNPGFSNARIYATKVIGSFTAALTDDIGPAVVTTTAYTPFHTEGFNPWEPDGNQAVAHTCIDGPGAPTASTQSVDTNISVHAQL